MYNSNIGYFMCVFNFRSSLQSVEYFLQGEEASCLLFAVFQPSAAKYEVFSLKIPNSVKLFHFYQMYLNGEKRV